MTERQIIKPKQGIILISEPSLKDFYFRQAVILLAEHNEEGTFGIIVNKPIEVRLDEVIKGFSGFEYPVYLGGPVKTDSIFFIHTLPGIENSLRIMDGLFWGGDIEVVRSLMEEGKLSEHQIRFFLGYSGWHPNQLDREINEKSWVLSHATINEVITSHPEELWSNYLKNMGNDYAIWANFPPDPALN
ncbi:MAG: YqgE/AlgH family protein [Bacteroidales bacterium]|nr:YqgE/AlgH family protein [Bacteroidales bacterium]